MEFRSFYTLSFTVLLLTASLLAAGVAGAEIEKIEGEVAAAIHSHEGYIPGGYIDARNCLVCHNEMAAEVMDSVHYTWRLQRDCQIRPAVWSLPCG